LVCNLVFVGLTAASQSRHNSARGLQSSIRAALAAAGLPPTLRISQDKLIDDVPRLVDDAHGNAGVLANQPGHGELFAPLICREPCISHIRRRLKTASKRMRQSGHLSSGVTRKNRLMLRRFFSFRLRRGVDGAAPLTSRVDAPPSSVG